MPSKPTSPDIGSFLLLTLLLIAALPALAINPIAEDPTSIDQNAPPELLVPQIFSNGAQMNALMYTANGPGPHPTVVLLHGFPGNEKNLDLAQTLRRAGFNVLFSHYRGAWGSGGEYSLSGVMEDVVAAIGFLKEKAADPGFRIDPSRISIAGHSLGGFGALLTGIERTDMVCTVALAPADLGASLGALLETKPDLTDPRFTTPVAGLKDYSYGSLLNDVAKDLDRYTLHKRMGAYKNRALLIVSAEQDEAVPFEINLALARAAQQAGASPFAHEIMQADHSFSANRIDFMRRITGWLSANCR